MLLLNRLRLSAAGAAAATSINLFFADFITSLFPFRDAAGVFCDIRETESCQLFRCVLAGGASRACTLHDDSRVLGQAGVFNGFSKLLDRDIA